jgi:hypothetical protein
MPAATSGSFESRHAPRGPTVAEPKTPFEEAAEQEDRLSLPQEFLLFLKHNKKWWLLPIIVVLLAVAVLAVLAGTGAAPFIYTLS